MRICHSHENMDQILINSHKLCFRSKKTLDNDEWFLVHFGMSLIGLRSINILCFSTRSHLLASEISALCPLQILLGELTSFFTKPEAMQEKTIVTADCCYFNPLLRRIVRFLGKKCTKFDGEFSPLAFLARINVVYFFSLSLSYSQVCTPLVFSPPPSLLMLDRW